MKIQYFKNIVPTDVVWSDEVLLILLLPWQSVSPTQEVSCAIYLKILKWLDSTLKGKWNTISSLKSDVILTHVEIQQMCLIALKSMSIYNGIRNYILCLPEDPGPQGWYKSEKKQKHQAKFS